MIAVSGLRELVNWQEGLISPAVLFDEDIYQQEQERVFGRAWLSVGHEDMIRKPGDYVTNYMGEVPVIVARDLQGKIHVLVNRCAHRGNQVCLFDRGNIRSFTCSYHGWTYGLDGALINVPMEHALYRDELDKETWGLEEVAQVANFKGMIFATFDPQAPPLEEWLGEDGCWWLQTYWLAEPVGGLQALPGWHRYHTRGNWKHLAENFIGDDYHVATTHAGWFKAVAEFRQRGLLDSKVRHSSRRRDRSSEQPAYELTTGYGGGCPIGMGGVEIGEATYENDLQQARLLGTEAIEWIEERHRRFQAVLQDRELKPYGFQNGGVFPNLVFTAFNSPLEGRRCILLHPRGPWEFELWQWTMVEREAPQIVKDLAAERAPLGNHMGGMIAPDDVENLERTLEAMRARRNWRRPHNYQLQLGHEKEGPAGLPGMLGPNPSEVNQRNFYRFWLELMERN